METPATGSTPRVTPPADPSGPSSGPPSGWPRQPRRRPALPRLVLDSRRSRRARPGRRLRLRHGEPRRAPAHLRLPDRLPGDQLAADRRAPSRPRLSQRGRGLRLLARHLRLRQGRLRRPDARRRAADGPHPEAGARGLHQRLQHLHQVGGDLGAHVRDADLHPRRARHALVRTRHRARPGRLRERQEVRRRPDRRAHHALRAGERPALRHRPAARSPRPRQHHEPLLEAGARVEPLPPGALQRAHRRHDLPRASPTACAATPGAPPTSPTWWRRWSTRRRTASAR